MEKLKEKIFLFIVVIALGVIFIPMLFTGNKNVHLAKAIPAKPENKDEESDQPQVLSQLKEKIEAKQKEHIAEQEVIKQPLEESPDDKKQAQAEIAKAKAQAEAKQAEIAKAKAEEEKQAALAKAKAQAEAKQAEIAKAKAQAEQAKLAEIAKAQAEQAKLAEVAKAQAEQAKLAEIAKAKAAEEERLVLAHKEEQNVAQSTNAESNEVPIVKSQAKKQPKGATQKQAKEKIFANHGAWAVQAGTFAVPEHASTLMRKLKAQGLAAYSRKIFRNGEDLTIVFIGPIIRKEDASKMISMLESKYKVEGIIIHYGVAR